MNISLLDYQLEFINSNAKTTVMVAGRGAGKSFVAAWVATKSLILGKSGMLIGPIFSDVRDVIVTYIIENLDRLRIKHKHNKSEHSITLSTGAKLYYRSAETENGIRGRTNLSFLIVDEAATVDYEIFLIAKACLRGANIRDPQTYLVGTPRGKGNWVYDISFKDTTKLIRAKTTDNKYLDKSFFTDLSEIYSNDFSKQELDGEFVDNDSSSVFTQEEWDKLNRPTTNIGNQVVVGVDVAAGGDDSAVTVIRGTEIINIHTRKTTTDISTLIELIRSALGGVVPNYIVVDSTGIGTFAPSEIKKHWATATILPVNFGAKANKKGYSLRRDEIHFDLKRKINMGLTLSPRLSKDVIKDLQKQFFATDYSINNNRDFKLLPKTEVKSKIGCSPDILDSVCLAASVDAEAIAKNRQSDNYSQPQIFNNRRQ